MEINIEGQKENKIHIIQIKKETQNNGFVIKIPENWEFLNRKILIGFMPLYKRTNIANFTKNIDKIYNDESLK